MSNIRNSNFQTNHSEAVKLDERQIAFLSLNSPKTIMIFVHGFNGKTIETWDKFPSMMCKKNEFSETDFVFYGYKSLDKLRGAADFAADFENFMNTILDFTSPENKLKKIITEKKFINRNYSNHIIVAHSLGAIVVRKALINACIDKKKWLKKTKMALFAPAHLGAHIDKLIFGTLDIILVTKIIALGLKYYFPVLKDLESNSENIIDLKNTTQKFLIKNEGEFTKAKLVVLSDPDNIVKNDRFGEDQNEIRIKNTSHSDVCKPREDYVIPVNVLIDLIL